jgi:heme/copper-type cytochrome/quinol oxidase subunit 2
MKKYNWSGLEIMGLIFGYLLGMAFGFLGVIAMVFTHLALRANKRGENSRPYWIGAGVMIALYLWVISVVSVF